MLRNIGSKNNLSDIKIRLSSLDQNLDYEIPVGT